MIVYEDHTWQTNSNHPDDDFVTWEESRKYWVVPDDADLAKRIKEAFQYEFILDDDGNLVDIAEKPIPESWKYYGEIESLKKEAETLDLQAVRPLRAIAAGTATEDDENFLKNNEQKVLEIRQKISELNTRIANETT